MPIFRVPSLKSTDLFEPDRRERAISPVSEKELVTDACLRGWRA